jgi:hypothetical protein
MIPLELVHFVITLDTTAMQIYINGLPMYGDHELLETIHIDQWDYMNTSTLQLFSIYVEHDQVFHGSIHQMDFYDVTLCPYHVATLYNFGVDGQYHLDDSSSPTTTSDDDVSPADTNATNTTTNNNHTMNINYKSDYIDDDIYQLIHDYDPRPLVATPMDPNQTVALSY